MNVTPMMKQYLEIKDKHIDCILFFRLGDFYEMFFDDAITASRELEITLTGRECGLEERAPMCGVPFHSADNYIVRLVEKGYKVAICEQVEEAGLGKGLVKRDVVRIVTPGTLLEGNRIEAGQNNYIATIVTVDGNYGLSVGDVSTGEWHVTEMLAEDNPKKLLDELAKYAPSECLVASNLNARDGVTTFLKENLRAVVQLIPDYYLDEELAAKLLLNHFEILGLESIGLQQGTATSLAAASLLHYLKDTQKNQLSHMKKLNVYTLHAYMLLDISTRRNLELTETLREKKRKGSLLWVLDHTKTAMGARYLRKTLEQPLIHAATINERLEVTKELVNDRMLSGELVEHLSKVYDLERLVSKIAYGTCNAKDMIALRNSLGVLPIIKELLGDTTSQKLQYFYTTLDSLEDVYDLIDGSIIEEPPISLREGGLLRDGFNPEVDMLRHAKKEGTNWLRDVETKEKEKTGIKNLKIKYNKVFGYFLEVTNSYSNLVPDYFIRKQTLANCERYITEELKEIEEQVLGADDKLTTLEYQLFVAIREQIAVHMDRLLGSSTILAQLDMFASLADVAYKNNYVCPIIDEGDTIHIVAGRHPVVEKMNGNHSFIANDVTLDAKENQVNLITGPNMAGKSTYMRQVALIVLMAQVGSFVPADQAHIGVVDRIFTRVGASDDLASGQSTFMIEMMEVSNILHHATAKSLLILDEIGRGTSTIDGLSIAWSIIEHIANPDLLGAKTLFATHYHELTALEAHMPHITNYCVSVKEVGEDIVFLHKMIKGSVDHSYGIQVAKLAGLPPVVLNRAKELMQNITEEEQKEVLASIPVSQAIAQEVPTVPVAQASAQLDLFSINSTTVAEELKQLNIMDMTPLQAMQTLYELQKKVK